MKYWVLQETNRLLEYSVSPKQKTQLITFGSTIIMRLKRLTLVGTLSLNN